VTTPVVTVRGEASMEVPPDLVTLAFVVHASASSAGQVRSELADASQRVKSTLDQFESALASVATQRLHVAPVLSPRTPTKITGYSGSYATQLVVRDFEALSPLVRALSQLPQSQLDGPWWSLRADHPSHRHVRLAAIQEARRRAADYAAAFGAALGDVVEVSDLEGGFAGPQLRAFAMAKGAEDASINFEPEQQTVTGQVTVRFTMVGGELLGPR
jgi:uncharacterized protein YggE